jgi:prepilin-type processing-associated H-X9-DG protein
MPDLGNTFGDYYKFDQLPPRSRTATYGSAGFPYLVPYKLAHILRSTEIALIFDTALAPSLGYTSYACAYALDNGVINKNTPIATDMTDQYGDADNQGGRKIDQATPVSLTLTVNSGLGWTAQHYNDDSAGNIGSIRFRHIGNTQANALMVDGHVQSFDFNPLNDTTDMVEKNICVNP